MLAGDMVTSKRKRPNAATLQADPTAERLRRAGEHIELGHDGRGREVMTMRDSPLDRALSRNAITPSQYQAGTKYRHHWYYAGLSDPLQSLDLGRVFGSDCSYGMARSESQAFHRGKYREAVQCVGLIGSRVLDLVVSRETSLEVTGYSLGWEQKPAAIVAATQSLREALGRLCNLWGI